MGTAPNGSGPPRVALIGVGEMGRSTLAILAKRLPAATFVVFDERTDSLTAASEVAYGRVEAVQLRVGLDCLPDLNGAGIVLNFAGPFFDGSDFVARAALDADCAYMDICDDPEGTRAVLALDAEARDRGVSLITGAGNSPGISNLMAMRILETYPSCDGIRVVWVVHDSDPGGLAPLRHMLHMAVSSCPIVANSELSESVGFRPETALTHTLPDPVGRVVAYDTAHPEPLTLHRRFPDLRKIQVQGALLPEWANAAFSTLGRIGFGDHSILVDVDGHAIEPAVVLWKLLWARHERRGGEQHPGITVVQVQGLVGDDPVVTMTTVDDHSMARTTGLGAAAATVASLEQRPPPGASGVEVLDAARTLSIFEELARLEGALTGGIRTGGVEQGAAGSIGSIL